MEVFKKKCKLHINQYRHIIFVRNMYVNAFLFIHYDITI